MMRADFFYTTVPGRALLKIFQRTGAFRLAAWFLRTKISRRLIPAYIKNNQIDMTPFEGQAYDSFAAFFARKRDEVRCTADPKTLISPCDSLLSIYEVTPELTIPMKGSVYGLSDLIPDQETAGLFRGGLCLVFRLQASDYHHFCFFDDGQLAETHFIGGQLHSVQPIAHRYVPVFRLNRRWWSVLDTEHFGRAVQIEVGAMLVGGVSFAVTDGRFRRGDEMGNFELSGSTIVLLLNSSVRERLAFCASAAPAPDSGEEVQVSMGTVIGRLRDHEE